MLHCYLKIAYYVVLILYYIVSAVFDWFEFIGEVLQHSRFAGIPTHGSRAITITLGSSIAVGNLCSFAMVVVYIYYITFHWKCSQKSPYVLLKDVHYQRESLLECSDGGENRTPTCNRHFVCLELFISNVELYFKEGVQTVLPLMIYMRDPVVAIEREWPDTAFAVCIIVINLKLLFCFITKLCGKGSGEKPENCERTSLKCFCCMFGCAGSLAFAVLSIVYLALT